ncbi:NB-ARC domain-containing protein [Mucilaginibacter oryzae]|uniref:NB-ARC domain-containing protein n=1 Tax=Mucilaginibacter oryzae TaxID=468058 RepID=A0A316GUK4_9SPHI|nr:NB-ARC domain-containing protein [Mucilaginibacter oryzae]PWK65770.1 NB-ARC domain-containing protein [Mucilaginibacter oryzae]
MFPNQSVKKEGIVSLQAVTVYYLFRKCFENMGRPFEQIEMRLWSRQLLEAITAKLKDIADTKEWFDMTAPKSHQAYFNSIYLEASRLIVSGKAHDLIPINLRSFFPLLMYSGFDMQYAHLDTCFGKNRGDSLFTLTAGKKTTFQLAIDEAEFDRRVKKGLTIGKPTNFDDAPVLAPAAPVAKKLIKYQFPLAPAYFIGREEKLDSLHTLLTDPGQVQKTVLLNGTGGMGKTTLMQQYLHEDRCKAYFDRIFCAVNDHDLETMFITNATQALGLEEKLKTAIDSQAQLRIICGEMSRYTGENLFVIDNVNESDFEDLKKIKVHFDRSGWKFLITTRTAPDGFLKLDVDELDLDGAMLLFAYHFASEEIVSTSQEATTRNLKRYIKDEKLATDLEELLNHIIRHTLLTELLAKAGRKKHLKVPELLNRLVDNDFRHPDLQRTIDPGRHGEGKVRLSPVTLHNYLLGLFETAYLLDKTGVGDVDNENEAKATMLRFFSVLPPGDMSLYHLQLLWCVKKTEEIEFENRLDDLKQIGWLQEKFAGQAYKMHKLVQEVVHETLIPTLDNCRPLIKTLAKILEQPLEFPDIFQSYADTIIKKFE